MTLYAFMFPIKILYYVGWVWKETVRLQKHRGLYKFLLPTYECHLNFLEGYKYMKAY